MNFSNKKTLIWLLSVLLLTTIATNIFTGIKLINYREILLKPSLIERVYNSVGAEYNFDSPIVFTGDSMIHRMNWNYIFQKVSLEREIKQITPIIFNRGIAGDTSRNLEQRFKNNILSLNPKAIFVEIGTNDLQYTTKENQARLINNILNNYNSIINKTLKHNNNTQLYIISILPVLKNPIRNNTAILINSELQKISMKNERIHFIDCFNTFFDAKTRQTKSHYFINSKTPHLNDKGYMAWAELIFDVLLVQNQN